MIAGKDFPSAFAEDNFKARRTGGENSYGNHFDPESLLTGDEASKGLDFANSRRDWPSEETYSNAVAGRIPASRIPQIAPRVSILSKEPPTASLSFKYGEKDEMFIDARGIAWLVTNRPFEGLRIHHEGFVEWPVKVMEDGKPVLRLASYHFNGNRNQRGVKLPRLVEEFVRGYLGLPVVSPDAGFLTPSTLPGGLNQ